MRTTRYCLTTSTPGVCFTAAVVADLHDRDYAPILPILQREKPDLILIPGDLTERLDISPSECKRPGLGMLRECASIAPTFYSLGNHEIGARHSRIYTAKVALAGEFPPFVMDPEWTEVIRDSGATLLDNSYVIWHNHGGTPLVIGGQGSGLLRTKWIPDLDWLGDFTAIPGYKLLLCHHPEYFDRYLRPFDLDMTVSGHAHGGQWRIFGRGVYAPDQHLFPKYTSGVHEDRLVISRGVVNTVPFAPRFFNPCEVVMLTVTSRPGREG
ncbi:MAG: metallophosphoesterase [Clostridia bacterium]|nr:metallophosphoesterase [Clostridia bacterium]